MARGFDLSECLVRKLIGPNPVSSLEMGDVLALCMALRLHPAEAWSDAEVELVGPVVWETEPFWVDCGLDPISLDSPARAGRA